MDGLLSFAGLARETHRQEKQRLKAEGEMNGPDMWLFTAIPATDSSPIQILIMPVFACVPSI